MSNNDTQKMNGICYTIPDEIFQLVNNEPNMKEIMRFCITLARYKKELMRGIVQGLNYSNSPIPNAYSLKEQMLERILEHTLCYTGNDVDMKKRSLKSTFDKCSQPVQIQTLIFLQNWLRNAQKSLNKGKYIDDILEYTTSDVQGDTVQLILNWLQKITLGCCKRATKNDDVESLLENGLTDKYIQPRKKRRTDKNDATDPSSQTTFTNLKPHTASHVGGEPELSQLLSLYKHLNEINKKQIEVTTCFAKELLLHHDNRYTIYTGHNQSIQEVQRLEHQYNVFVQKFKADENTKIHQIENERARIVREIEDLESK
ncbi:hypothetical protein AKO1_014222, partial [Acrasis kona]